MKIRMSVVLGIICVSILISTGLIFSQDETAEGPSVPGVSLESEMLWIWGDVVSVDKAAKKILVKYLDYETDTEKEINIIADDKTTYENVKSFDEIKAQDTLSVDYVVGTDGSNIARNISAEKPEVMEVSPEETFQEESTAVLDSE